LRLFSPERYFESLFSIDAALLRSMGIRGAAIDLDNTLAPPDCLTTDEQTIRWLEALKEAKFPLIVVSNNHAPRVEGFCKPLGLQYHCECAKPLGKGLQEAVQEMALTPQETALIGDQIFTDVLGARLSGLRPLLIAPRWEEQGWTFRLKRTLERKLFYGRILKNESNR